MLATTIRNGAHAVALRFPLTGSRRFTSSAAKDKYKIIIAGGGSAGLSVANQIYDRFKAAGKRLSRSDIAIIDAAEYHYYQPGWQVV
ncbi:hypothetical protein HGRIS_013101 [Hohenbuehelia grisea]|uniref:Uncharacterized protein n=1 Tax=Hohenbuehelia grisea TaxID=104357 RepID=A0ABR3IUG0_9AGAR